jgi:ribosomal protein L16 Arg81 hydroxylase
VPTLSQIARAAVFDDGWPAEPQLIRPLTPGAVDFLTFDDVERYTQPEHRPTSLAMVRDSRVTGEPPDADHPASTLVIDGLHTFHPPLRKLAENLERWFSHPVTINAYRTPPGSRGFAPHWDTEPNLLVQTAGRKLWHVAPPVIQEPSTERHRFATVGLTEEQRSALRPTARTFSLWEGESLFIPRGWVHWGETGERSSLHFTVAWHVRTWAWLLAQAAQQGAGHPALREALPPRFDGDDAALRLALLKRLRLWAEDPGRV